MLRRAFKTLRKNSFFASFLPPGGECFTGLRSAHSGMGMTQPRDPESPSDQGEVRCGSSPLAISHDYIGRASRKDFFNGLLDSKRRLAP